MIEFHNVDNLRKIYDDAPVQNLRRKNYDRIRFTFIFIIHRKLPFKIMKS